MSQKMSQTKTTQSHAFRMLGAVIALASVLLIGTAGSVLAQDAPPVPSDTPAATAPANGQAGAPGAPSPMTSLLPFILVFAIMYFLMIRPQQKRMKEHKNLLETLKKGDDVVTASGFIGKIAGITEKVVTLELADNVRVKILKSQISQVVKGNINDAQV